VIERLHASPYREKREGTVLLPFQKRSIQTIITFIMDTSAYSGMPTATDTTTIKIRVPLKHRLDSLKVHPRESYTDVIERLVEMAVDDEPLSDATIKAIEESLEDIKKGRVYTLEQVMAELKDE
jgi:predicted transcriptional regulator